MEEAVAVAETGPKMWRSLPVRKTVVAMVKAAEDLDMCCTPRCP